MVVLRADPWMPDFGMGFQPRAEEAPTPAEPFVEAADWSRPIRPPEPPDGCLVFIDGVRRAELRLVADADGRRVPGLFGSAAAGVVRCDGRAAFGDHVVSRATVLGGGVSPPEVEVPIAGTSLCFRSAGVPGIEPEAPLAGLQEIMRKAEGLLAAHAASEDAALVLADGPLAFFDSTVAPVVGVVKRTLVRYLPPEQDDLVARLEAGERTPLFGLGEDDRVRRYSWYSRLVPLRGPWHDRAGIVRCEVRAAVGLETAVAVADRATAALPAYAGRPSDPRTPQNLAPIAALEGWLRHRLGHAGLIRRALLEWMSREAA